MLIDAKRSQFLLVDVQENLAPIMADGRSVYRGCGLLLRAAERLGIPLTVSEQYPKGLGPTVGELKALVPPEAIVEKIHFSCQSEPAVAQRIQGLGREQVVIAGIEAHVCVLQSALELKAAGYQVFVAGDACSSRAQANHQAALRRMEAAGIGVVSVEMAVFEWLHRAATPEFKELVALVK
jgi:Amidases related to nicotinamidase